MLFVSVRDFPLLSECFLSGKTIFLWKIHFKMFSLWDTTFLWKIPSFFKRDLSHKAHVQGYDECLRVSHCHCTRSFILGANTVMPTLSVYTYENTSPFIIAWDANDAQWTYNTMYWQFGPEGDCMAVYEKCTSCQHTLDVTWLLVQFPQMRRLWMAPIIWIPFQFEFVWLCPCFIYGYDVQQGHFLFSEVAFLVKIRKYSLERWCPLSNHMQQ
jgi:hypothetical protein